MPRAAKSLGTLNAFGADALAKAAWDFGSKQHRTASHRIERLTPDIQKTQRYCIMEVLALDVG